MGKVGIMTFLHNENCGSGLQAWALQETLRGLGWEPLGLDYRPDRGEQLRNLLCSGNSPAVVLDSMRRRKAKGERNTSGFNRFLAERLSLSEPCANGEALRRAARECSVLLCGSDQVWSPEWLNPAYFLDFAEDQPRVAYACSLGVKTMPGKRKAAKMKRLVFPFRAVSLREEEGKNILQALLPEKPMAVTPDPVLLLTRARWLTLAGDPVEEPALAAYFLRDDPGHWRQAEDLARQRGLRLVPLAVTEDARARENAIPNPDPIRWLAAMASASAVITDSFHGAAMAAVLGKPLTVTRRWKDGDPASKNSRIDQLMRLAGWTDDSACLPSPEVEACLSVERERGIAWLQQSLQG